MGFMPHTFTDPHGGQNGRKPAGVTAATKQSRNPCNRRNIYPSGGDCKSPPLLAVGGHIRRGSLSLSSSTPAAATHASSSAGAAVSSGGGSSLLVDLYSSGPDTNEDAGEFGCRNFIMNPELAIAVADQENNDNDEQVSQDVLMKTAITHLLKRNTSSRDLSFTIIELTNMIQALINNHRRLLSSQSYLIVGGCFECLLDAGIIGTE